MVERVYLEDLCLESKGTNLALNAMRYTSKGDESSAMPLYLLASKALESELKGASNNQRRGILENLYECYQKLYVESILPGGLRRIKLDNSSYYYTKRLSEISEELNP